MQRDGWRVAGGARQAARIGRDYSFDFYMETKNVAVAYDTHKVPKIGG